MTSAFTVVTPVVTAEDSTKSSAQVFAPTPFTFTNLTSISSASASTSTPDCGTWLPILEQRHCAFASSDFEAAMLNLVLHPNINSTSIMRADILYDSGATGAGSAEQTHDPAHAQSAAEAYKQLTALGLFVDDSSSSTRTLVRVILPRNSYRDKPLPQSCMLYKRLSPGTANYAAMLYVPHVDRPETMPYYHPEVSAILLHYTQAENSEGVLRLFYRTFPTTETVTQEVTTRLERTALRLLHTSYKHSNGIMRGYQKRVHHDLVVNKVAFQTRYVELKQKYAKKLIESWVEATDPKKHVFEDLSIAAFLLELWHASGISERPGFHFVDLGCGNGVLVYILLMEEFKGFGIEARRRKTWDTFPDSVQACLHEKVLLPYLTIAVDSTTQISLPKDRYHDGKFTENAFLIGNHSDELTPWIPLLGRPFIVIPCCSHALSGKKYRYPTKSTVAGGTGVKSPEELQRQQKLSTYGALVEHVAETAHDVGWIVKREMLRIPSTRNTAIIGLEVRQQAPERSEDDNDSEGRGKVCTPAEIIAREGGADGFLESALSLVSKNPRSH
ncbi:uncharacterized protein V1518DRAFT_418208 [Limtongia smithiae]|uniref:uncharacterized protein n=1 Tax=Limtongia smithiae TaxID=1125753 RepID=UPI0034CFBEB6